MRLDFSKALEEYIASQDGTLPSLSRGMRCIIAVMSPIISNPSPNLVLILKMLQRHAVPVRNITLIKWLISLLSKRV